MKSDPNKKSCLNRYSSEVADKENSLHQTRRSQKDVP